MNTVGTVFKLLLLVGLQFPAIQAMAQTQIDNAPQGKRDGWSVAKPSQVGLNPQKLADLTTSLQSGDIHNVHAVIIEHDGKLVYEEYFSGPDERWGRRLGTVTFDHRKLHDLRSVSKSVTTAVLGIALAGKHRQALGRPVTSFFPELEGKFGKGVEKVTLKHALTMTAGLQWNEMTEPYTSSKNDEIRMSFTDDPVAMVLGRDVINPVGTQWYYNGGLSQVLAGVVTRLTGTALDKFAAKALFRPLGIKKYEWLGEKKWESPSAASGLRLRARDMAKIGSMFLHQGRWNDKQIVPADWVDLSTQSHVKSIPWGNSTARYGYGFMWYPGTTSRGGSHHIIRAAGNGGQRIFLLPRLKLAITIFAGNYNVWKHHSDAKILKAVLSARN